MEWFISLGDAYSVDPIIFGSIYVGAIPFFALSLAWLIRNKRKGSSTTLPALSTGFWLIAAYLYLFVAGENLPWWTYGTIGVFVGYGGYVAYRKIQSGARTESNSSDP